MKHKAYNPKTEEIFHIAGDEDRGIASTMTLSKNVFARPQVRYASPVYGDMILECDVYKAENELTVHLICPKCRHNLQISSKRKAIELDSDGKLSIEPFQCTWELNDELLGEKRDFGFSLCRWTAAIDKGVIRHA